VAPATVDEYRAMSRYARLRHRLEWSWLGSGAYFMRDVWWNKMWRFNAPGKRRDAIIRDKITLGAAIVLAVAGAAVLGALTGGWVGAVWMPVKLFVVPFLLFVQIIGFTVYVHHVAPDIRWWTKKEWTQFHGQMDSTTILRIPRLVNVLWFHNIFVHVPHHVDARIRFDKLPKAAAQIADAFPDTVRTGRLSIREYLRATRACKLYDFEAGSWVTYAAARADPGASVELIAHRAANRPPTSGPGSPRPMRSSSTSTSDVDGSKFVMRRCSGRRRSSGSSGTSPVTNGPEPLAPIMDAAGHDAHLWFDLKGFTPRLTAEVLTAATGRPLSTMSCRSWWLLRAARGRNGVRTVRSIGARWQLWWATRRSTPTVDGHGLADRYATPATVAALRRRNPFVAVWGVTDAGRLRALDGMGVSAVIADDLGMLAVARGARGRTLSAPEAPERPGDHDR
jgi:hypothetical protein